MSKITKRKYVMQEMEEFVLPSENQQIVKVTAGRGNNLHEVVDAHQNTFLVSMPVKFRNNIWIKRGNFVIVDPIEEGDKVKGEIVHILYHQKQIHHVQDEGLWPEAFGQREVKSTNYIDEDMMPPSDSDEEEDLASKVWNANKGNLLYEEETSDSEEEDEDDEDEDVEDGEEEEDEEGKEENAEERSQDGEKVDDSEEMTTSSS